MLGSVAQIFLIVFSGLTITAAQACLSVLSRGLAGESGILPMFQVALLDWKLWTAVLLYGAGMMAMFLLLRYLPLAQVSVGIWAVTIVSNVLVTLALGQSLAPLQFVGIALVFGGMVLLQA